MITVVSRGAQGHRWSRAASTRGKILVNPNGADLGHYAPAAPDGSARCARELGFTDDRPRRSASPARSAAGTASTCWRTAIPRDLRGARRTRSSCSSATAHTSRCSTRRSREHGLEDRVTARRPRAAGRGRAAARRRATSTSRRTTATWSTASSSDRRPRSSSTWRWAAASSRSDLEQIGEVLSPALRVEDLRPRRRDGHRRAVGALHAGRRRRVRRRRRRAGRASRGRAALGRNARQAVPITIRGRATSIASGVPRRRAAADRAGVRRRRCVARTGTVAARSRPRRRSKSSASRPATPTRTRSRTSGTTTRSGSHYAKDAPAAHARVVSRSRAVPVRRLRAVDARGDGVRPARAVSRCSRSAAAWAPTSLSSRATARTSPTSICRPVISSIAQENFALRGLAGPFVHHDAETLPFADNSFDIVYSNGVHPPHAEHRAASCRRSCACSSRAARRS